MRHVLTEEQQTATRERRGRFRELVRKLGKLTQDQRNELAGKLSGLVTCEGHALSVHNLCLIACQMDGRLPTMVGGFRQWKRHGRRIKKGEHGLMIWFPTQREDQAEIQADAPSGEHKAELRFLTGYVFDISQTEEERP